MLLLNILLQGNPNKMLPLACECLRGDYHYVEGAEITSHSRAHEEIADTLEHVYREEVIGRRFQPQDFIIELRRNWKTVNRDEGTWEPGEVDRWKFLY